MYRHLQGQRILNQFPYFGKITQYTSFQRANYNALQLTLSERAGHGLNLTAGYSFSHALDNKVTPTNSANPNLDYANSLQDPRNNLSVTASYNIPGIKAPGQVLQGWQVNTVVHMLGGVPFNAFDGSNDFAGTGGSDTWTLVGNPRNFVTGTRANVPCFGVAGGSFAKAANCTTVTALANMPQACIDAATAEVTNPAVPASNTNSTGLKALTNFGCYSQNGSVIVPPAQGTFGAMSRAALRAAPFKEWDLSVTKNTKFGERLTAQFRAEMFNVINHPFFASPSSNPNTPASFGQTQQTPNSNNPIVGEGGARQIQLGLKLIF